MNKTIFGKNFFLREDTLDEYVVKENNYKNCSFLPTDVWLDIGGNIGVFPILYSDKVEMIVSFEPDVDNCLSFKENLKLNSVENCILIEKAVVDNFDKEVSFFINVKKNKGGHSMFVKRGRTEVRVPAININEILKELKPNKIKLDIEGGEYNIIKAIDNWKGIEELIFEYHINILRDRNGDKLAELYEILNKNFKTVIGKDPKELGGNWVIIVHCKN